VNSDSPPQLTGQQVLDQLKALKPSPNGNGFMGYGEEHN
jgi:hypothetical protein